MKAYWGSGSIAPRILDLGTKWKWVVSFTPRPFYPQGKSPKYALDRRLGGPQRRSGRGGEEKNSQPLPGLVPPIIQPVAQRYTIDNFLPSFLNIHSNIILPCTHTSSEWSLSFKLSENNSIMRATFPIKLILWILMNIITSYFRR
jgi:hypothetical protein